MPKIVSDNQINVLQKSQMIWSKIKTTQESGSNSDLFMFLLELYGVRIFQQEIINACLATKTEFLISPYFATSQLVYLFKSKYVTAVSGSLMCLFYENAPQLNQVIVGINLQSGIFQFVEKDDLLNMFSPNRQISQVLDLFLVYGSLYNMTIASDTSGPAFAETVS